jgi:hypothetical protein
MTSPTNLPDSSLASLNVDQKSEALFDYGKLYSSTTPYLVCYPDSIQQVQELIRQCKTDSGSIRVRASGHTFNGCTLPRTGETLVRTNDLNWYRFEERSTVTVGAGALVWDIRDMAAEQNLDMPVYNGGWAGPSLGGYISAGGFGKGSLSDVHGGLWENILSITLVDGQGEVRTISRGQEQFKWLFGSYGQLGIIVEAKLKLIPNHPSAVLAYPKGSSGRIPRVQEEDPAENDRQVPATENILFWFSLLISPDQEALAWKEMTEFCRRYPGIVVPDGGWAGPEMNGEPIGYHYNINFHTFNPPLVYPIDESFIVMGVMSLINIHHQDNNDVILKIETDFIDIATRNDFKLYSQAENIGRNVDYKNYYSDVIYNRFKTLKIDFDPSRIINPGVVFSEADFLE